MGSIIYILIGIMIGIIIMMAIRRLLQKANLDMWYKVHSDEVLSQVKQDIENELKQRHGGKV
jgi:uncharacterized membrane-anchored protein YhcB (DUF1043 family)